ncbi:MAG: shikimate dehydrogenase [bacterium]
MTSILGILGHPLGHSLSVPMHMSAIFALGIDYVYLSFDVQPEELQHTIAQFKKEHIKGFNVTIPYKERIIDYLDDIDQHAKRIGAVNTVNNEDGRLKGYNTDGIGYLKSLKEQTGFDPEGKQVLMLGAGGAARAVAFSLLESGIKTLFVANRTVQKAERLIQHLGSYFQKATLYPLSLEKIVDLSYMDLDLIVNTTSVGMKNTKQSDTGRLMELLKFDNTFNKGLVVSDIVYNPPETPLLRMAKQAGLKIHDGIGMLVYQGAESFKIWTGIQAPVEVMRQAVSRALQEHH